MIAAKERLDSLIKSGNIPHALLFTGSPNAGIFESASEFARELLQTKKSAQEHPDIHLYHPEGKTGMHPISSIRQLSADVFLSPYEGKRQIFILDKADRMLPTSSNALLKTLEEPAPHTVLILLSYHPERLLPTVLSRLYHIEFSHEMRILENASLIALLTEGFSEERVRGLEGIEPDFIFEAILLWYRDRLALEIGGEEYLYFPRLTEQLEKTSLISLEAVEKSVKLARLAYERSTKLETCLEMLFLKLKSFEKVSF